MRNVSTREELSAHIQRWGYRPICEGEPREEYVRGFASWLAERITLAPELVDKVSAQIEENKE